MTRILFVVPDLDFDRGEVSQFGRIARHLHSSTTDLRVAVLSPRTSRTVSWVDEVPFSIRFLGQNRILDLSCWQALRAWIRAEPIDVLHAWGEATLRQVGPALARLEIPSMIVSRFGQGSERDPTWIRLVDRWVTPTADVCLDHMERPLCPVVEEPVRSPSREELRERFGLPSTAQVIISAGRFDRASEHLPAVRTFDYLKYVYPNLHLLLIGDGPGGVTLWRWVENLARGVIRTRMPGAIPNVIELLPSADVVWVPNVKTGGINVLLEGMAAARPVIASQLPYLEPLIRDGETGFLVPPGDLVTLARVTRRILDNADLGKRIGWAARAYVREEHRPEMVAEELIRFYAECRSSASVANGGESLINP